jgi:hypothetical protein
MGRTHRPWLTVLVYGICQYLMESEMPTLEIKNAFALDTSLI